MSGGYVVMDGHILLITETWLHPSISGSTVTWRLMLTCLLDPFRLGLCGEASDLNCLWESTLWKIWLGAKTQWTWRKMPRRKLTSWGFSAGTTCPRNRWCPIAAHWDWDIDLLSVWVWSSSCRFEQWKVLRGVIKVFQKRPGCLHPTRRGASALNTNTDWIEF